MKNKIILLSLLLFAFVAGQAQDRIGLKVFPEFSRVYSSGNFQDATNATFTFGGGIQLIKKLLPVVHLETGLYLQNRGMNGKGIDVRNGQNILIAFGDVKYRYQYLSFPLLLRFDFGSFYMAVGPEVDVLLDAEITYTAGSLDFNVPDNDARNLILAGAGAVGFNLELLSRVDFFIETRAQAQLTRLYSFDNAPRIINIGIGTGINIALN